MRLIDADELRRRMYDEVFEKDSEEQRWDSGCWIRYRLFEKILKDQPTIEPEHKTGKWIKKGGKHICPNCGSGYDNAQLPYSFNYCPNCGCKMEVE